MPKNRSAVRRPFVLLLIALILSGCNRGGGKNGHAEKKTIAPDALPTLPVDSVIVAFEKHPTTEQAIASLDVQLTRDDSGAIVALRKLKDVSDNGIAVLSKKKAFSRLRELQVSGRGITDAGMRHVAGLTQLEILDLSATGVTGKGLDCLGELSRLRVLDLSDGVSWYGDGLIPASGRASNVRIPVPDEYEPVYPRGPRGGRYYRKRPDRALPLSVPVAKRYHLTVNDVGLAGVGQLTSLVKLNLSRTSVTDAGLIRLEGLSKLEVLKLSGIGQDVPLRELHLAEAKVTAEGLSHWKNWKCPTLRVLDLSKNAIVDEGIAHLTGFAKLNVLILDGNPLTDLCTLHLADMSNLKRVALRKTRITAAGVKRLGKSLMHCKIDWDGSNSAEDNRLQSGQPENK